MWQPIATAPKNGTRLFLCCKNAFGQEYHTWGYWSKKWGEWVYNSGIDADFISIDPIGWRYLQ